MVLDVNKAKQRHEEVTKMQQYRKAEFYKWKDGKNILRILPGYDSRYCQQNADLTGPLPEGARDFFAVECRKAGSVGPNKKYVTLAETPGPLEEYLDRLHKLGDTASKKEADASRPKNRAVFFVIDREDEMKGPQVVDWNMEQYNRILGIIADPEYGDITCPFRGSDLVIDYVPKNKTKNGFPQWTNILARRQSTPLTTDANYWYEWLAKDLFIETGQGVPTDPEYIKACIEGREKEFAAQRGITDTSHEVPDVAAQSQTATSQFAHVDHPFRELEEFWVNVNGAAQKQHAVEISAAVLQGGDPQIMPIDQSKSWGLASAFGFKLVKPQSAPAPMTIPSVPTSPSIPSFSPAPSTPPVGPPPFTQAVPPPPQSAPAMQVPAPPPAMSGPPAGIPMMPPPPPQQPLQSMVPGDRVPFEVPPSEQAAFQEQLARARQAGTAQHSQVGQDLRAMLGGK